MNDLEFQLRQFSKSWFESFVCHYLQVCYPGAGIKCVEGAGGDEGIDVFSGSLTNGPAIWQAKHFPDRIREPQKRQILESLKAGSSHNPTTWTLCVPINLRTEEHRWFEVQIVNNNGGSERIKLIQASDLLGEVRRNRQLRDAFFRDNAISNILDLRKAAISSEKLTTNQLEAQMIEYAQQFLEGDLRLDPRLTAVVSIGNSHNFGNFPKPSNLVMSISTGERSIHYLAKDPSTYQLDPLKFTLTANASQGEAFRTSIDTGQAVTIPAGQLLTFESASPFLKGLFSDIDLSSAILHIVPQLPPELERRTVALKFIAGQSGETQELRYVPFRIHRAGQAEVALKSEPHLPFEMSLIFRFQGDKSVEISLTPKFLGADAQIAFNLLNFLEALSVSKKLRVESVETGLPLFEDAQVNSNLKLSNDFKQVVKDLALVSKYANKQFSLPPDITDDEIDELHDLAHIFSGEDFSNVSLSAPINKQTPDETTIMAILSQESMFFKIENPPGWKTFRVLGQDIDPGAVTFIAEHVVIDGADETRKAYQAAKMGELVMFKMRAVGPCRFIRWTDDEEDVTGGPPIL